MPWRERLTPEGEKTLQMMRQALNEAYNLNNPIVLATLALAAGVAIGIACSRLLTSQDDDIKRLRAEASDLSRRIDNLAKPQSS
jgi:uncharacterized membrane-anchored protein YhcB (DUF1043 family)